MSFTSISYPVQKTEHYMLMYSQIESLTDGISHPIANLANTAALLWQGMPDINWCGFYLMDHGALMLGPFCGLPACIRIPLGRGVCGTAAQKNEIQRVYDVHEFPGHIACDSASNSEIVIPIHHDGHVIGVLDIDSPDIGRFDEMDQEKLLEIVRILETGCDFSHTGYTF